MMVHGLTGHVLDLLVTFGKELLLPFLTFCFFGAMTMRFFVYWTVKREKWFVDEFDRRLHRYMHHENPHGVYSFSVTLKRLLEKTFYELFESRSVMRRRKTDHITEPMDRLFLISEGSAYLVRDTMKYASNLRKDAQKEEKDELIEVSKNVLANNPGFNKLFGVIPIGPLNDFLNQLPGLFIVGGIFGTFLGIMKALPELQGMNPTDAEGTKLIMDEFLIKIAFSMSTSTMGILYSVAFTVFNSFINPEKIFVETVSKYEQSLHQLWRRSENNEMPKDLPAFDEHRDPVEALAELALQKELAHAEHRNQKKKDRRMDTDENETKNPPSFPKDGKGGGNQAA